MGMEGSATVSSGDKKSVKMSTEICFAWKDVLILPYSFILPFFTPVPLIVGRWYIHQITRKWCFGSQGGLDKSSFGTFNLSHANLKKCLNLIKVNKTFIISIKGDDGRLPVDHPGRHGDEDEDCSEGQPTPSSRKQHRLEPLIRCRKPFIGIYMITPVFLLVFRC